MGEQELMRVIVADIESLDVIHEQINALLGQIADTIMNNKYILVDQGRWISGLRLIQQMKKIEVMNTQKRETLDKIKVLITIT